jgi:hypothetical protein
MRRLLRVTGGIAVVFILAFGLFFGWLSLTAVSASGLPPLKNGDIVFQLSGSGQSVAILLASRSPYTHMGIVDLTEPGQPKVIEAVSPVKRTPLEEWVKRGRGGRITVKRDKGLTPQQALAVVSAARSELGKPYDPFFTDGEDAIYCSELVRLAYEKGLGISLGKIQSVAELDLDYAPVRALIERRWTSHPFCREGKAASFDACYAQILKQKLVTPVSIAKDPRLQLIFTNFGPAAE